MTLTTPANPCSSCPYRCDTPPGIWHPDEYRRLPAYDVDVADDPPLALGLGVFLCHHANGAVCAGWLAVHGDHVAARLAVARGELPPPYTWPTPTVEVYPTSTAAADAGLVEGEQSIEAFRAAARILTRRHTRPLRSTDDT